jgi:polysaccharide biosynthesis/export protein
MKFLQLTAPKSGCSALWHKSVAVVVLLSVLCCLPVFGQTVGAASSTAAQVPAATSVPLAGAVPLPNYKITASDLLEIEVFGVEELKRTVRVNTAGSISLPLVGMVQVAGLTATEAEALIAQRYDADFLRNPQVSVFIKEFTTLRVTIDGAVAKPGIYPLTGQITLLRALALAGGGAQLANMEDVLLFRLNDAGAQEVMKFDVKKIRNGELEDPMLKGDDLVVVNKSGARELLKDSIFRDVLDFINPFSVLTR